MYETLIPFIKYLWGLHWIFRINPFDILHIVVGPAIIFGYMKPQMSALKRSSIVLLAIFITIIIYVVNTSYSRSLRWYEYHLCADKFESLEAAREQCGAFAPASHLQSRNSKKQEVSTIYMFLDCIRMLLLTTIISPFLGWPRFFWRVYHRKTIKAMGSNFKGKRFNSIMIFLSIFWILTMGAIVQVIFFAVYCYDKLI